MRLSCEDTPRLAGAWLDGDLPVGLRLRMGMHLAICRACRAYLRGLERTRDLARQSLRGQAPAALLQRLGLDTDAPPLGTTGRVQDPSRPEERAHDDPPDRPPPPGGPR